MQFCKNKEKQFLKKNIIQDMKRVKRKGRQIIIQIDRLDIDYREMETERQVLRRKREARIEKRRYISNKQLSKYSYVVYKRRVTGSEASGSGLQRLWCSRTVVQESPSRKVRLGAGAITAAHLPGVVDRRPPEVVCVWDGIQDPCTHHCTNPGRYVIS